MYPGSVPIDTIGPVYGICRAPPTPGLRPPTVMITAVTTGLTMPPPPTTTTDPRRIMGTICFAHERVAMRDVVERWETGEKSQVSIGDWLQGVIEKS